MARHQAASDPTRYSRGGASNARSLEPAVRAKMSKVIIFALGATDDAHQERSGHVELSGHLRDQVMSEGLVLAACRDAGSGNLFALNLQDEPAMVSIVPSHSKLGVESLLGTVPR